MYTYVNYNIYMYSWIYQTLHKQFFYRTKLMQTGFSLGIKTIAINSQHFLKFIFYCPIYKTSRVLRTHSFKVYFLFAPGVIIKFACPKGFVMCAPNIGIGSIHLMFCISLLYWAEKSIHWSIFSFAPVVIIKPRMFKWFCIVAPNIGIGAIAINSYQVCKSLI